MRILLNNTKNKEMFDLTSLQKDEEIFLISE